MKKRTSAVDSARTLDSTSARTSIN